MNGIDRAVLDRAPTSLGQNVDQRPAAAATQQSAAHVRMPEPAGIEPAMPTQTTILARLLLWTVTKLRARRSRQALLELTDDQLKDIGLSRCQAYGGAEHYRRSSSYRLERNGR
jgi:uncharacterized protein YjiS (DUF1127 family)